MPSTDSPDAFVAATAASLEARRAKLVRAVRNQKIRMRIAFGCSGCIAIFAFTAYLIRDLASAKFCALLACVTFAFTYLAGMAARKAAAEALQKFDQSG